MSAIFDRAARRWEQMRGEYELVRLAEYEAASAATRGHLLSRRGLAAGQDSWTVFTGGPHLVRAYGSDELREHLQQHPRTTLAAFEAAWLTDREDPSWPS